MRLSNNHYFTLFGLLALIALGYVYQPFVGHASIEADFQSENTKQMTHKADRQQTAGSKNQSALDAMLIAAQSKQIDQQRQEIQRLTEQLMALTDAPEEEPDDLDAYLLEDEQAAIDEHIALLNATLAAEGMDSEWSQQSSDKIVELFDTGQLQQAELVSAHCGATLCRIEAEVQDEIAAEHFFTHFALLIDWPGSTFAQLQETQDGRQNIVFFVSREGYALPDEAA